MKVKPTLIRITPAFEKVKEEVFGASIDVQVSGVNTGTTFKPGLRDTNKAHLTVGSQNVDFLMRTR